MKCFNHSADDALGVCRHCARGLCRECLSEREGGVLACRGRCEAKVDAEAELVARNIRMSASAPRSSMVALPVYALGIGVFAYVAYIQDAPILRAMCLVMCGLFLIAAISHARIVIAQKPAGGAD